MITKSASSPGTTSPSAPAPGADAGVEVSRDPTEPQQLLRELRESQEYCRGLIESNIDAFMTTDPLGTISDVNRRMCEMTGVSRERLIGTPFERWFTDPRRAGDGLRKALAEERITDFELVMRSETGKTTVVSFNVTAFRSADGTLKGFFVTARDITERKRLEEQNRRVEEANRLKSAFLANMSHELRTPLNGIIGFTELMHDGKVGPVSAEHKEYLGDILTSSYHLLQLINDVLDLSKVESGKMVFRPEPIDLPRLVSEVRDIVRTLANDKRIGVEVRIAPALGPIVLDPAKLRQVLYNYLSNALKFTPDGGHVVIHADEEGVDRFRLAVEDDGIGIDPEDFARLFVEFHQLDASASKRFQGTGLGLALTRRIVEAQGGRVGVTSTPGRGSTFTAILPRVMASSERAASRLTPRTKPHPGQLPVLHPPPGTERRSILIVDDDPNAARVVEPDLRAHGFEVAALSSAEVALAVIKAERPAAVILDLMIPGMDGFEFLKRLRESEQGRHLPVVVWTVKDLSPAESARLKVLTQGIVQKQPGAVATLIEEIRSLVPPAGRPAGAAGVTP